MTEEEDRLRREQAVAAMQSGMPPPSPESLASRMPVPRKRGSGREQLERTITAAKEGTELSNEDRFHLAMDSVNMCVEELEHAKEYDATATKEIEDDCKAVKEPHVVQLTNTTDQGLAQTYIIVGCGDENEPEIIVPTIQAIQHLQLAMERAYGKQLRLMLVVLNRAISECEKTAAIDGEPILQWRKPMPKFVLEDDDE